MYTERQKEKILKIMKDQEKDPFGTIGYIRLDKLSEHLGRGAMRPRYFMNTYGYPLYLLNDRYFVKIRDLKQILENNIVLPSNENLHGIKRRLYRRYEKAKATIEIQKEGR